MNTCRSISQTISELISRSDELTTVTSEDIASLYLTHLSEVMKLAFDINLDAVKLYSLSHMGDEELDSEKLILFLIENLEHENTYRLLNYYQSLFLKAYLKVMKLEKEEEVVRIFNKYGINQELIRDIRDKYSTLYNRTHSALAVC